VNGAVKCQQISGGDGYATMGDGTQTYMFSFGPLSGLNDIALGLPGTEFPNTFNQVFPGTLVPGDPATTVDASGPGSFTYNGAVGLAPDLDAGGILDGHVDPRQIMDIGVMNGNIPAPLLAIDEDDEFFLTLTNVGMIMRPDLFEQHTVHFHGYPNASSVYDGVPDASVAINIGGSFTYYYLAPDAGTYFWHCHITPPNTCRWAWWASSMCDRGRIGSRSTAASIPRCSNSRRICARPAIPPPTSCAATLCRL